MSTDITIQAAAKRVAITFDEFVDNELDGLARSAALVLGDHEWALQLLTPVVADAWRNWNSIGFVDEVSRWVFGRVIADALASDRPVSADTAQRQSSVLDSFSLEERAIAVARFGLGWSPSAVSMSLGVTEPDVELVVDAVAAAARVEPQPFGSDLDPTSLSQQAAARADIGDQLLRTDIKPINVAKMKTDVRRKRIRTRASLAALGIAAVATFGTFIANSNSTTVTQPAMPTLAVVNPEQEEIHSAPAPGEAIDEDFVAAPADSDGNVVDRPVTIEPPPTNVRTPHLITIDGQGAFAGARSPAFRNPRSAIFTSAVDGESWVFAGRWPLADYEFVKRFERIGDHYFAWVGNALAPSPPNAIKIGMSVDLVNWTTLRIPVADRAPDGLIFSSEVAGLAVSGPAVLVLVTTSITIDYAALALVESDTCGFAIERERAYVDLCNEALLEISTTADGRPYPYRSQLFISRSGAPFESVIAPFDPTKDMMLTSAESRFGLAYPTGVRYAVSDDAVAWAIPPGREDGVFEVRIAATGDQGETVGLIDDLFGQAMLFRTDASFTDITPVADLIGKEPIDYDVTISNGPAGWAVYLHQAGGEFWLFHSADGLTWDSVDVPPPHSAQRVISVGDDELLIQTVIGTGPVLTRVPLGQPSAD